MSSKDIKVIVKGRFIHQLMTSADNTGNSATITREFVYTKSRSFTTKTFHESVSSVAKKQSQSAGTRFETSGSYGVVSASVSGEYSINNELEEMLQETNRSETTLDVQLTTTETQKYPVGPHSKLYVYYRYFEGPGMKASTPVPVTRPAPMPDQELTEEVDIEVVLTPMPLLKRLHIVSSRLGTEAPANRIRERFGKNDNINHDQGGMNQGNFNASVPFFNSRLFNTAADWNYTTANMSGLGGRAMTYPQGHILGGTSEMNGLAYTRGSADDYDRYAAVSGDTGWSWDAIQTYLRRNERWTPPADHHNTTGEFDPAVHSFTGINAVSLPGFVYPDFDYRVINASLQLEEFPFNLDMNSGDTIGIGWTQSTIDLGVRSSSATSYLAPQFASRPNLDVLTNSRVTRLLQTGTDDDGLPLFTGVEFADDLSGGAGPRTRLTATKEVILSSGALGSPQVLQRSGIGDPAHLASLNIPTLVALPSVGQNLTDHAFVANTWLVNSTDTFETALRNATLMEEQTQEWIERHQGPYAAGTFNEAGWLRLPPDAEVLRVFGDPSAGNRSAHYEFIIANGATRLPIPPTGNYMVIGTVVVSPLSRGQVLITSPDAFSPSAPLINPNLLSSDFDLITMRSAIRAVRRFAQAPAFADYVISLQDTAETDEELEEFIRGTAITVSHCVGTSAMSPKDASWGVVDPDLKVKGVRGLRVVDSSAIPLVPAAHSQVATYVFAERGADLIKGDWVG
ncbi:hypothetical protein H0H92_010243 [Tricholoma furcatifolium]|nr:hypothetical protein H0H92_010243 [Tricholoma furcatifolium]